MNPELVKYEMVAKELLRRVLAEEDAEDIRLWLAEVAQRAKDEEDTAAFLYWMATFEFYERLQVQRAEYAALPEDERKRLDWPWTSWNTMIDPLQPGMLAVLAAPSGCGKTTYAECIAEHWARKGGQVAFLHWELSHETMLDRRLARNAFMNVRQVREGVQTAERMDKMGSARDSLRLWLGGITYIHAPGWTADKAIRALDTLQAQGKCDVVVIDYLEKIASSNRQLKFFGANTFQREADNVEQIKIFSERAGVPVLMLSQLSKRGRDASFDDIDSTAIRGAGEKSEKANLVVLLKRARTSDGYANEVQVLIDKNTLGPTGTRKQIMQPEYFRVADIAKGG